MKYAILFLALIMSWATVKNTIILIIDTRLKKFEDKEIDKEENWLISFAIITALLWTAYSILK